MNCKQANTEIALWVGSDLDDAAENKLKRHLAKCPKCRTHWKKMRASLRMLQNEDDDPVKDLNDSIWPGLARRLPSRRELERSSHFNGWVPALAVIAACVVIFVFLNDSRQPPEVIHHRPIQIMPASFDSPTSFLNRSPMYDGSDYSPDVPLVSEPEDVESKPSKTVLLDTNPDDF